MKKIALFSAIALATVVAPAFASEIDVNLQSTAIGQLQDGEVTQRALSAAAAVGSTANNVTITSSAVNAAQLATMDVSVVQGNNGFVNANLLDANVSQTMNNAVDQAGASIAGSGNLGAGSDITSTAANLAQSANVSVRVRH